MFMFSAFEELWAMAGQEATMATVAAVASMAIEATDSNSMPTDNKESPKNQEEKKPVKHENPKDHEQEMLTLKGDGHVTIKVQAPDGGEVFFRIGRTSTFRKLMHAYCAKQQVEPATIVFLFEGRRLLIHHTPLELEMEDGDIIDAMLHLVGGGSCYQSS